MFALFATIPGCGSSQNQSIALKSSDFTGLSVFIDAVNSGTRFKAFEGLPHQYYESTALKAELKKNNTIKFLEYPFYAAPVNMAVLDELKLNAIVGDPKSFEKWVGEKKCGGFHPDYALEWTSKAGAVRALLCFGCREIIFSLPNMSLRCDLQDDARDKQKAVLSKYRINRPPESFDPPS